MLSQPSGEKFTEATYCSVLANKFMKVVTNLEKEGIKVDIHSMFFDILGLFDPSPSADTNISRTHNAPNPQDQWYLRYSKVLISTFYDIKCIFIWNQRARMYQLLWLLIFVVRFLEGISWGYSA